MFGNMRSARHYKHILFRTSMNTSTLEKGILEVGDTAPYSYPPDGVKTSDDGHLKSARTVMDELIAIDLLVTVRPTLKPCNEMAESFDGTSGGSIFAPQEGPPRRVTSYLTKG